MTEVPARRKVWCPFYVLHSREVSMSGVTGDIQNMRQPPGLRLDVCSDISVMLSWMTGWYVSISCSHWTFCFLATIVLLSMVLYPGQSCLLFPYTEIHWGQGCGVGHPCASLWAPSNSISRVTYFPAVFVIISYRLFPVAVTALECIVQWNLVWQPALCSRWVTYRKDGLTNQRSLGKGICACESTVTPSSVFWNNAFYVTFWGTVKCQSQRFSNHLVS